QDSVAVREGAALGILAAQPNGDPLDEQRGEGERLRLAPVDPALVERGAPPLELLGELRVDGEALRRAQQLLVQLAQPPRGDGGDDRRARRLWQTVVLLRFLAERRPQSLVRRLELDVHLRDHLLGLLGRDDALPREL